MKTMINKTLSLTLIVLMLMINLSILMPKSNAKSKKIYYFELDRAPEITVKRSNQDYLTFSLNDKSGIKSVKVEEKVNKKYKSVNNKSLIISKDKKTVKIKKELFEIGKRKRIRVTAYDNDKNSNKIVKNFKVKRAKKKNKSGNYFLVNNSPNSDMKLNNKENKYKEDAEAYSKLKVTVSDLDDDYFDQAGVQETYIDDKILNKPVYYDDSVFLDDGIINKADNMTLPLYMFARSNGKYSVQFRTYDTSGIQTTEEIYIYMKSKNK